MIWKSKMKKIIGELRADALQEERINQKKLDGCEKDKDKQYWNGYQDALENVKRLVKRP